MTRQYVVYETDTLRVQKTFVYRASANKLLAALGAGYSVTDILTFRSLPMPMKTVKNLMTGEEIVIPADTPRCCDPSTELYWSM
jgi:hypothetical protein